MDAQDKVRQAYQAFYRRLVTQVYGLLGDLAEAEDAVQEAFARVVASPKAQPMIGYPAAADDTKSNSLLYTVDTATGRIAPLAHQPKNIDFNHGFDTRGAEGPGDTVWLTGSDAATHKPAVAWSGDRGRTWATHVFTDIPALPGNSPDPLDGSVMTVVQGMAGQAFVVINERTADVDQIRYRTTDGGKTWQSGAVPSGYDISGSGDGILAVDGTSLWGGGRLVTAGAPDGTYRRISFTLFPP